MLRITSGELVFEATLLTDLAPKTVEVVRALLPLRDNVVHGRWSGESVWVPFGDAYSLGLDIYENATCHPSAGEILIYKGDVSEVEVLIPYGNARFSSKAGDLPGNHFATVTSGREHLPELGRRTLWDGAQELVLEEV